MTDPAASPIGSIAWHDLTVPDATGARDFYQAVVGWQPHEIAMGDYADFAMLVPATGQPAGGICHARGSNANLPPQWLIYITVANLDQSLAAALARGGEIVDGPRALGEGRFAVIRDPAGAVCALYQLSGG